MVVILLFFFLFFFDKWDNLQISDSFALKFSIRNVGYLACMTVYLWVISEVKKKMFNNSVKIHYSLHEQYFMKFW